MLKDYIEKYKDLVDYFLIDDNGNEIEIPSEDAEFMSEWFLNRSVKYCNSTMLHDGCVIILDDEEGEK